MRYMQPVYGCERPEAGTPERAAKAAAVRAFTQRCAQDGVLPGFDPLHTTDPATTVRGRDGEEPVTDGPFAETAEQLGGYYTLECAHLDEALGYAALCPMAAEGSVEVRPIVEMSTEPTG